MKPKSTLGLVVLRLQIFCISCILLMGIKSNGALVIQHEEYWPSWRQGNDRALSIVEHGFYMEPEYYTTPYVNPRVSVENIWFMDWTIGVPVNSGGMDVTFTNGYYYNPHFPNEEIWADVSVVKFNVPVTYALIVGAPVGYRRAEFSSDCIVSAYLQGELVASGHVPAWHSYLIHDPDFTDDPLNGQAFDEIRITGFGDWGLYIGIHDISVDFVPEISTSVMLVVSCCLICRRRRLP